MNHKTIIELGFRLMPKELYADLRGCYPTRPITSLLDLLTRNSSTSQGWIHYYMKKIKWQTIIFAWLSPVFWHKIWKILFTYLFISTSKASEKRPGDDVDLFIWELKQLYDDDHNDDFKKNQWSKQQLCTCITVFSTDTFPWLPLHDYDVKPPDFTFYVGREHTTTNFPLSFWTWIKSLRIQLQEKWPAFDILSGSK